MSQSCYGYRIEYVQHSKSVCASCKQIILQGEIRLGGNKFWRHIDCLTAKQVQCVLGIHRSISRIPGLRCLSKQDSITIHALLQALALSARELQQQETTMPPAETSKRKRTQVYPNENPEEHERKFQKPPTPSFSSPFSPQTKLLHHPTLTNFPSPCSPNTPSVTLNFKQPTQSLSPPRRSISFVMQDE